MEITLESNSELLTKTKNLVTHMNEKTVELLERLREIENRKLHIQRGYSSLFAFVTEDLGFSSASAMRRINAMHLMKEIPEVKEQISSGVLNLTTVSQTQQHFKKESYAREAKLDLLVTLENKSTRLVEKELAELCPQVKAFDRMKPVSLNQNEVKFIADDELVKKLEKLKALKSHSIENLNDLLNAMADLCLKKWEPRFETELKSREPQKNKSNLSVKGKVLSQGSVDFEGEVLSKVSVESEFQVQFKEPMHDQGKVQTRPDNQFKTQVESRTVVAPKSQIMIKNYIAPKNGLGQEHIVKKIHCSNNPAPKRYVSRKLKAKIFARDQGCCQYTDALTGKKCHSQQFLQLDHVQPFALGGETTEMNLRLYCSAHNQWQGLKSFGWGGPSARRK